MAKMRHLKGMSRVLANLSKELVKVETRTVQGLIRAGILIRRDMEFKPPLIPVDVGNLRASWFLVASLGTVSTGKTSNNSLVAEYKALAQQSKRPKVILGFTAAYAMFVHENIGVNFKRPGAGAKFLESALKRNTRPIIKIIQKEAMIP